MRCQPVKAGAATLNVLALDAELCEQLKDTEAKDILGMRTLQLESSALSDAPLTCVSILSAMRSKILKKMPMGSMFNTTSTCEESIDKAYSHVMTGICIRSNTRT